MPWLLKAPPIDTSSSIAANAAGFFWMRRARFVIGPSAMTLQCVLRIVSSRNETASVWKEKFSTGSRKLSPKPSAPCVSSAFT